MTLGVNWAEVWNDAQWAPVWLQAEGGEDSTPLPFTFVDQTNVEPSTQVTSNAITVAGITVPASIAVVGGTYEVNLSGVFTSTPGSVLNGDLVRVRHTSSEYYLVTVTTTLTIGGVSDSFSSLTRESAVVPNTFTTPRSRTFRIWP